METKTFKTIFIPYEDRSGNKIEINKIEIPKIQRDFAYGRTDKKNERKRESFLDSLIEAINGRPIILDFIYGDIKENVLTPLDGQQRLTTLYLLYWYASKKESITETETNFLKCFSYETRPSARKFCETITTRQFELESDKAPSEQIKDKNWFPLEWQHDATIASMLVMLDAIHKKFACVEDLYTKLENISFYFLPIKDMGLTDELYIKINSRGKPLTQFEHFKAEFIKQLKKADEGLAKRIGSKIDREWTDLLWQYRNSCVGDDNDNTTDDEFLRYFIFICNIICYKDGGSLKANDEFDLIKEFFTISNDNDIDKICKNAEMLEEYFDCWLEDNKKSIPIQNFFETFVSKERSVSKIKTNHDVNLFEDCLRYNAIIEKEDRRKFKLSQIILLYAFVIYRQNVSNISEIDFRRRIRIINNLILNSSNEISDSEGRQSGNRMPAILRQVDSIILNGVIADNEAVKGVNFNPSQLEEEREKLEWTQNNPNKAEALFALEDHELLYGQISIVGLENLEHFERFESLFKCNWDLVDCALFTIGDYKQKESRGWRYQLGSSKLDSAWRTLFHKSKNLYGFDNTKKILNELLSQEKDFTDEYLEGLKKGYLANCESKSEYPWIYYYIKYDVFRTGRFGKYGWDNFEESPYVFTTIHQEQYISENSYNPFLKVVNDNVWREYYGKCIRIDEERLMIETQTSYQIVSNNESEDIIKEFCIHQNADGIDTENRIEKMKSIYQLELCPNSKA